MIFHNEDDIPGDGMFYRRVSENGLIHIGINTVLFGFRVRAGFCAAQHSEIDWCAGASHELLQWLYMTIEDILLQRDENARAFDGIPPVSDVKPAARDFSFMSTLAALTTHLPIAERPEPQMLPPLSTIRTRCESLWSDEQKQTIERIRSNAE